ncbi:histidine kinase [Rummeliibacillus sp. NPDC094406]|uniref:histidine kinase n=1 Tax=Rummeliibacillus sp. NPDC094406 TaxID=3364511 RepID=UPI003803AAF8
MRRYLSIVSLMLFFLLIVLGFITPQVLNPLPDSWDIIILLLLLLGSFLTALFSKNGLLKIIALIISSIGMLVLLVLTLNAIGIMIFGNFGT